MKRSYHSIVWVTVLFVSLCSGSMEGVVAQDQGDQPGDLNSGSRNQPPRKVIEKPRSKSLSFGLNSESDLRRKRSQPLGVPRTTSQDGVLTTRVEERAKSIVITENSDGKIVVQVTRHYGADDMGRVKRLHPELADYIELFPKQIDEHEIALSLSIKSTFRADGPEQLKALNATASGIYRRYRGSNR